MSDMYKEILVKRKTSAANQLAKAAIIALTAVGLVGGIVFMFIPFLVIGIAGGVACYFLVPKLDVEYEYLYVNGDLDIDAIYSRQKRKKVAEYTSAELELLAPENSHALDSYKNKKDMKVRDFTSGDPQKKNYIMVMNKDKGQELVKVELDEAIVNDLRRMAPRKVNLM